jgi:glycosyltransferase involved in cell wall biosynthesis
LAEQVRTLVARDVLVLPNGVDLRRFDPAGADRAGVRGRLGIAGRLTVGWCGILREWHGLHLLLEAMRAVPDAILLVVGDGPARRELEERAAAAGLAGRLIVTGRVAHELMPDYLAAMDIAAVPDERTGVASPMKLLEYMAMARAVVAPRLANIQDVACDERDVLLFAPGNVTALGDCLRRLAGDPGLRTQLGAAARATVVAIHTWRHNAAAVLAAIGGGR